MDLETIKALDRLSSAIEHLSASIANQLYGERSLSATLTAAQQSVQRTGYQSALIPCPHCGVNITVDSDMLIASR